MKRLGLLLSLVLVGSLLTACPGPTPQIVEVERPVVVEKQVLRTVEVLKEVPVEKVVKETVEVIREVKVEVLATPTPEPVQLTFWHVYGESHPAYPVLTSQVEAFNASQSAIQIEALPVPGGNPQEKLLAAIAGGNPPDVAMVDASWMPGWSHEGAFTPLDEFAAADGITGDEFYPTTWEAAQYGGHLYAVPHSTGVVVLLWNKDHFAEVGLDPDSPPTTIAELEQFAEKLDKYDEAGNMVRAGFIPWVGVGALAYVPFVSFGADLYDEEAQKVTLNDPQLVKGFEWGAAWAQKYGIDKLDAFAGTFQADAFGLAPGDPFYSDQLSMVIAGDWEITLGPLMAPGLNFGIAATPYAEDGGAPYATATGGYLLAAPRGSRDPAAAWEFMQYLTSIEAQEAFAGAVGVVPVRKEAQLPAAFRSPGVEELMEQLMANAKHPTQAPISVELSNRMVAAWQASVRGVGDPQTLLDEATQELQARLDELLAKQ